MIGVIGQRTPDVRHPLDALGRLDVVKDRFHLASGFRFIDKFHQSHKSPCQMWSAEWQAYHSHPQDAMHAAAFVRDRGSAPLHRGSTPLYSATMANADCGMRSAEWK